MDDFVAGYPAKAELFDSHFSEDFLKVQYGGFLKCGYPHSWLVYNGKSYQNG
jgi:hypothetical protein